MAIFQFTILLIPRPWAEAQGLSAGPLKEDGSNIVPASAWAAFDEADDMDAILSRILPSSRSWHQDLSCWGDGQRHDIQLWREEGKVQEISIRLDLREKAGPLLVRIVEAAIQLDCLLLMPDQQALANPNAFDLKRLADQSDAAKFAHDPVSYIQSLGGD